MYLNCHSNYSLRYGTIPIEDLVVQASQLGYQSLALTDINVTNGIFDFITTCKKHNIKPLVGCEFRNGDKLLYIALAKNQEGLKAINDLISRVNLNNDSYPVLAPFVDDVLVIYPFADCPLTLRENEYLGVHDAELNKLQYSPYGSWLQKHVVLKTVTVRNQREWQLHKVLRCIDKNIVLPKLKVDEHCPPTDFMQGIDTVIDKYKHHPTIWPNTMKVIDSCNFDFDFSLMRNIENYSGSRYEDGLLLERLVDERFEDRYPKGDKIAKGRVEKELQIIGELGFTAYFLCTWDIVNYSLSKGYYHVGRGSGANSIVAYILKITNVCPIELDLYFERFLNPARKSPPDFDIDWAWNVRDEILDYIFEKFGEERTAFCGVMGTFKRRSSIREIGKVFGLPKGEIDSMIMDRGNLDVIGVKEVSYFKSMVEGFPSQRSMHSCGVFISELPITNFTALDRYPKGYQTTQMDMYVAENIGLEKFDILSQRGLGTIDSALKMVKKNHNVTIDFNDVNVYKNDPKCNEAISRGETLGCFYVESPAMRGLLRRLKANSYLVLVAASSVIRPGVAKSGMLREYQVRHNKQGGFKYQHKVFEEHLGETYGIMVYQEDVMKIAHHFGGLDMAEADILRRGMSGKTRSTSELQLVKSKFFANCKKKGHPEALTNEVYRQIESFAGYSFCKSHSASYAVESYLAIYLKVYFPLEFMVSAINNFGGFYRREVYFHEVKMAGGILHNPCVNHSEYYTRLIVKDVYVGFVHMNGFNKEIANKVVSEREQNGRFDSLEDFISRLSLGLEHLKQLIYVGAFDFTGLSKNKVLISAVILHSNYEKRHQEASLSLFEVKKNNFQLPDFDNQTFENAFDEIDSIDFTVTNSVFDLLKTKYRGNVKAKELHRYIGKRVRLVGYTICRKRVPTVKGEMSFFSFWDDEGIYFETTSFPNILKQYPYKGHGIYLIEGIVAEEFEVCTIEIQKMDRLPMVADPRFEDDTDGTLKLSQSPEVNPSPLPRKAYPSKKEVELRFNTLPNTTR